MEDFWAYQAEFTDAAPGEYVDMSRKIFKNYAVNTNDPSIALQLILGTMPGKRICGFQGPFQAVTVLKR